MRFVICLGLCLLGLVWSAPAAAVRVEGFSVKAGATYASPDFQFDGAEILEPSAIYSPVVAGSLILSTSRKARFHLMAEMAYTQKGYRLNDTDRRAGFVSIPLLLRSTVSRDGTGLHIFFGPVLDLVVSRDDDTILDAYRSWAFGGQAGMGMEFRLNRQVNLLMEFRFSSEFTNVLERELKIDVEGDLVGEESLSSVRHRALQLSAGVRF